MKTSSFFLVMVIFACNLFSQTFDLQFVQILNNGTNYDLKIQIRGSASFKLGTSNIGFDFNGSNLGTPALLTAHNYSGTLYNTTTVTNPLPHVCSVNIELFVPNNGSLVNTTWTDVATIRFPITNPNGTSAFSFRPAGQNQVHVFSDTNLPPELTAGTLFNMGEIPLPVELTNFSVTPGEKFMKLNWETVMEFNNIGFEIERSEIQNASDSINNFKKIGFVEGQMSSNFPKYYSFTDNSIPLQGILKYRLKQLDHNGSYVYSKIIEIKTNNLVKEFLLNQNYPNPFNPSTLISYQLSENCFVILKVYDILGNEIATLVNEDQSVGIYNVSFSPVTLKRNIVSGVYLYKLTAGKFSSVRKMILAK